MGPTGVTLTGGSARRHLFWIFAVKKYSLTLPPMAETAMTDRPKRRQDEGQTVVSARQLAKHLDLTHQRIGQLVDEHVLVQLPNGRYDQDDARVRYLRWLRDPERRPARPQADANFVRAKTELIDIRIREKKRELMRIREKKRELMETDNTIADMEKLIGIVLTKMSGMGARIGGRDLQLQRRVDEVCTPLRALTNLERTQILPLGRVRRAAEEDCEVLNVTDVIALRLLAEDADGHVLDHATAKRADGCRRAHWGAPGLELEVA